MLQFIFGTSGAGKTSYIRDCIKENILAKKKSIFIIPEQQAYISEKDFAEVLPKNAGLYFQIASFSRIAQDVTKAYGGCNPLLPDDGTKAVFMWETLRKLSPTLKCFSTASTDRTLCAKMLSEITELRNNGLQSEALMDGAQSPLLHAGLCKKLYDLALIESEFSVLSKEAFGGDEIDRFLALAKTLKEHDYFAGAEVFIDSFTSFTAPEYQVLEEILKQADKVTVSLCTDALASKAPHFETLTDTYKHLRKIAAEFDIPVTQQKLSATEDKRPAILSYLSEHIWDFSLEEAERPVFEASELSNVKAVKVGNIYEESEWVAEEIEELVSNGMKFSDIALIVRNTEAYFGVLDAALERHHIPFFLSENTDLSSKPLSRLILCALRCVSREFRQADVIPLLKTGLAGANFKEVALFEEYCETWHINGNGFFGEAWTMNPDGLTEERSARGEEILTVANEVKARIMHPLKHLYADLHASNLLRDRCRAVFDYLNRIHISDALSELAKKEISLGEYREAEETVRLYNFLLERLTGLAALLPDSTLEIEEFISLLTLLFAKSDFGSVPNLHNCVTIGSANTLRVENLKVSFLLGLCEGEFPKAISTDGLLSEEDKAAMEKINLSIETREKKLSSEELLFVYRAIAKPKQALFFSFPQKKVDGSLASPSLAINRVCFLLKGLEMKNVTPKSALLQEKTIDSEKNELSLKQTHYNIPEMPNGSTLYLSASSVREFALCPYQYFIHHRMHLREKKDSSVRASDEGSFLHFVFQQFLRRSLGSDGLIRIPSPEEVEALADEIIELYLQKIYPIPPEWMDARLLHLFRRLRILALQMLQDILTEIAVGKFQPTLFEEVIGKGNLPPVVLPLPKDSKATLCGTIDRIDYYECPETGKTYLRIIDYKSGEHKFSIENVESGTDIQLVLYLIAALAANPEKLAPGSAQFLYAHMEKGVQKFEREGVILDQPFVRLAIDTTEQTELTKRLKKTAEADMNALMDKMKETVTTIATMILAGDVRKTPSADACRFCPVKDHCSLAIHSKNG